VKKKLKVITFTPPPLKERGEPRPPLKFWGAVTWIALAWALITLWGYACEQSGIFQ
jgi:hypothetical protein